ncbi:MAG: peroxiredoxin [Actinobacteria bacterium]|nr:peroxiredoxin [Actinomycetota bacterium]
MAGPAIGQQAPDFTLPGLVLRDGTAERSDFTLSQHRGAPIVLAFYPGDETPVCTKQMCAYSNELEQFNALGAQVWGISPQDLDSHERFARKESLTFPLLADVGRGVVNAYGIGVPGLGLRRSTFLVDADGVLRWKNVSFLGLKFDSVDTLAKEISSLTKS